MGEPHPRRAWASAASCASSSSPTSTASASCSCFSSQPGAFSEDDVDTGLAVAAHAAVAVAAAEEIDNLHVAIDSRTVIGQATGVLMERYQLTADAAFGLLKRFSMEQNEKVVHLARRLVGLHHAHPAAS